ncbi:MAG TPA: protein phosphatase 2C domain-containing protein [Kofleriaceae bacterium]|nr:protein phosphatase 2C domain-containing protein [Kofleriaceae bacterium]
MKLEAVMLTDVGVVRDHNEDSAHVDSLQRFFIVADGMGGHAAGEVASAMAVETVKTTLESATSIIDGFTARPTDNARRALVQLLQSAVLAAHQSVYQRGTKESDKAGMGTTLDVLLIAGQEAFVAHVGDSRTYLIRDGKAAQLTTDHTVAEVLVIEGKLTIEEALVSPYRTVLVNAIGVAADVGVEMAHLQLKRGDRLLLCSDGLHDYFLAEQEIADMITAGEARSGLANMVELAKERGGHDNITGVAITIVDLGEAVPAVVETDQTLPVEVPLDSAPGPGGSSGWNDDERTENISPKELDKLGSAPSMPRADEATRPTAPMSAVMPGPEPEKPSGTENTDPSLNVAAIDKAIAARDKRGGNEDQTEPALDASLVKAALARARALHSGSAEPRSGGSVGDRGVGAEDPTLPPMPVVNTRGATEPPPAGEKPSSDDDKTVEHKASAKNLDGVATEDTGPLPRVDGDKVDKVG